MRNSRVGGKGEKGGKSDTQEDNGQVSSKNGKKIYQPTDSGSPSKKNSTETYFDHNKTTEQRQRSNFKQQKEKDALLSMKRNLRL